MYNWLACAYARNSLVCSFPILVSSIKAQRMEKQIPMSQNLLALIFMRRKLKPESTLILISVVKLSMTKYNIRESRAMYLRPSLTAGSVPVQLGHCFRFSLIDFSSRKTFLVIIRTSRRAQTKVKETIKNDRKTYRRVPRSF